MTTLTTKEDWDQGYVSRKEVVELQFGWRHHINRLLADRIEEIGLDGKSILEIGAGDSQWIPYFAKKYASSRFAGLDYSQLGCERLAERVSAICGAAIVEIYCQDMFDVKSSLHGKFDLVMSFGVVEHFTELSNALYAKCKYLNDQGLLFTIIPNMAGSIGYLSKLFNREIFEMHNPHDLNSFIKGHRDAGLVVLSSGYLGSTNFGVLSSCFEKHEGLSWHAYVFLTRLSKAVGLIESKLGNLPASKPFAPYIYAVSRVS